MRSNLLRTLLKPSLPPPLRLARMKRSSSGTFFSTSITKARASSTTSSALTSPSRTLARRVCVYRFFHDLFTEMILWFSLLLLCLILFCSSLISPLFSPGLSLEILPSNQAMVHMSYDNLAQVVKFFTFLRQEKGSVKPVLLLPLESAQTSSSFLLNYNEILRQLGQVYQGETEASFLLLVSCQESLSSAERQKIEQEVKEKVQSLWTKSGLVRSSLSLLLLYLL